MNGMYILGSLNKILQIIYCKTAWYTCSNVDIISLPSSRLNKHIFGVFPNTWLMWIQWMHSCGQHCELKQIRCTKYRMLCTENCYSGFFSSSSRVDLVTSSFLISSASDSWFSSEGWSISSVIFCDWSDDGTNTSVCASSDWPQFSDRDDSVMFNPFLCLLNRSMFLMRCLDTLGADIFCFKYFIYNFSTI